MLSIKLVLWDNSARRLSRVSSASLRFRRTLRFISCARVIEARGQSKGLISGGGGGGAAPAAVAAVAAVIAICDQ